MSHALAPRNSTDRTLIAAALVCLFVALAAKSKAQGAPAKARIPKPPPPPPRKP